MSTMPSDVIADAILRDYPYPIAKCYERLIRTRDIMERHDQVRYLFEVTIKYCASIAIAEFLNSAVSDPTTDQALRCLTRPSLGHWVNLIRQCMRSAPQKSSTLAEALLAKRRGFEGMANSFKVLRSILNPEKPKAPEAISVLQFSETMVAYRNRSVGHGAPKRSQTEEMAPVLERGVLEMLQALNVLTKLPLVYLASITVERARFKHGLIKLMGTAPIALPPYITEKENALIGHDGTLFLLTSTDGALKLSLHPLMIYVGDEIFFHQSTDLTKNVEYLCYHTGANHHADHVFQDFKDKFARYLDQNASSATGVGAEEVYRTCLETSLIEGTIGQEERAYLQSLATHLGMNDARAGELERTVRAEFSTIASAVEVPSKAAYTSATESITAIAERQDKLLQECGAAILDYVCSKPEPSKPIRVIELAAGLAEMGPAIFRNVSAIDRRPLLRRH